MNDLNLSAITGLTVTAQIFLAGVSVGSSFPVPEIGLTGEYSADMPDSTPAGEYLVIFYSGAEKIGAGWIVWDGGAEVDQLSFLEKVVKNKRQIKKVGSVYNLFVYDDDGVTPIMQKELKDILGQDIADLVGGVLASEGASSV